MMIECRDELLYALLKKNKEIYPRISRISLNKMKTRPLNSPLPMRSRVSGEGCRISAGCGLLKKITIKNEEYFTTKSTKSTKKEKKKRE